jgi:fido (protein-threonine AMPylation protein)
VSDEASRTAEQKAREQREADFVRLRISELHEKPIAGSFDLAHLRAIHAQLFRDLPEHQPGVIRMNTCGWRKARELEGGGLTEERARRLSAPAAGNSQ